MKPQQRSSLTEVQVGALPLELLARLLEPERAARLEAYAEAARGLLGDRVVWNINATASGGGVAEMLLALLAYARGAGVDARWLVLNGDPDFFRTTKRLHNFLHGSLGDEGDLGEREQQHYEAVLAANLEGLTELISPGDLVLLHDPQTAGLVTGIRELGAHVVWRAHIGADMSSRVTEAGWSFLRPYVSAAEAVIFSRAEFVPRWVDPGRVVVIPPSLDPFSPKNRELGPDEVEATLRAAGIVDGDADEAHLDFARRDGSQARVRQHKGVVMGGGMAPDVRYVLQVSRWDRLKDMAGVVTGFAAALDSMPEDVHLVVAGPRPEGVSDDPEGAEVSEECLVTWLELPDRARRRIHLCNVPTDDVDENAHIVNALQRRADLVVQKSVAEGFGLTVTEPMWKARAVLASRVGGIQDQIVHGESGVLLDDPRDLAGFGRAVTTLMRDDGLRARLGAAARERVRDQYLGDRHLIQYVDLFASLLG
ncbi:MAG TPA: glycosyltransferase [Nocardioides sp.]|uniref:glycosyltransferase n=1 Tax=Nocardioides sp. TaxID=35761 RepID=UPI002E2EDBF8|nr:glycosyltransferase [Nocardioides sp.]HEX5088418.1 glycosyltransferase [Nocardioides sp.]